MTVQHDQQLVSNGYTLANTPERFGYLVTSDPTAPINELRTQYEQQGYLWLKGLLDRDRVLAFREHYFRVIEPTGLLEPNSNLTEAHYAYQPYDQALHDKLLMELVRTAAYEAFCLNQRIWQFYEALLGGAVYLHKRKILRTGLPGVEWNTPAHYDLIYLRGGTDSVVTGWIPIGDTPIEMGGLIYLEGSDRLGRDMEAEFAAKNATLSPEERISAYNKNMLEGGWVGKNLPEMADRFNTRWLVADYEAGDVMVHSSYMIHAATMNTHPSLIRLSTDIRYQRVRDETVIVRDTTMIAEVHQYRMRVWPHVPILSDATAELLRAYVAAGGMLVVGCRTGYKNEYGHCRMAPLPGLLTKLCGAVVAEYSYIGTHRKAPMVHGPCLSASNTITADSFNEMLRTVSLQAEVLATYATGDYAGQSALIRHNYKQGTKFYYGAMSTPFFVMELLHLLDILSPTASWIILPVEVELFVR